tara:strand:+ start:27906 stop:28463 length:558 start_codon:yes stop_codon:yes gene_type:complete
MDSLLDECASFVYDKKEKVVNPWIGTPYEEHYLLTSKEKGAKGEEILRRYFSEIGCEVEKPLNPGHDMLVNGVKVECKFSLATKENRKNRGPIRAYSWMMNHVSAGKDWEWLCFVGVNPKPHEDSIRLFSKETFRKLIKGRKYFSIQQGGDKLGNDDWITTTTRLNELLESEYVIKAEEWKEIYA